MECLFGSGSSDVRPHDLDSAHLVQHREQARSNPWWSHWWCKSPRASWTRSTECQCKTEPAPQGHSEFAPVDKETRPMARSRSKSTRNKTTSRLSWLLMRRWRWIEKERPKTKSLGVEILRPLSAGWRTSREKRSQTESKLQAATSHKIAPLSYSCCPDNGASHTKHRGRQTQEWKTTPPWFDNSKPPKISCQELRRRWIAWSCQSLSHIPGNTLEAESSLHSWGPRHTAWTHWQWHHQESYRFDSSVSFSNVQTAMKT